MYRQRVAAHGGAFGKKRWGGAAVRAREWRMLSNLKKKDLQQKEELGDKWKQADELSWRGSAAGEGHGK